MRRFTSDRWLAAGTAVSGIGAIAVVGYWVYVISGPHRSFFNAPGYVSAAVLAIGIVMLAIGFFAPASESGVRQSQRAGDRSTNVQVGGDIRIGGDQ